MSAGAPLKIAYIVSRFPHVSETFILRELNAVDACRGVRVDLFSLFAPVDPTVHTAAQRWVAKLHRGRPLDALSAVAWWLRRRPVRLLTSLGALVRGYWPSPQLLLRALATAPIAAAHARRIQALGISHVHAHYATYPALAAWLCRRLTGIPYSFTAHAHDLFVDQSMLVRKAEDACFVVAVSDFNRRFLSTAGARSVPVHVIHCGIAPDSYSFRPRALPAHGPVRALCVASLQDYKGHRVLFEALARGGPLQRLELDLVGRGELRGSLERLAHTLGIAHRVHFRGGLTEEEVASSLDRADLFVLPSLVTVDGKMEGLPVALMEALACGLPVVATRLSGIPELVRDGETGTLAEPGDPSSLAAALASVLSEPAAARTRAADGRALVETEFDVTRSADRLLSLFRRSASAC